MASESTITVGDALLVDAHGVAEMLAVTTRTVWSWHSSGKLPLPVRLGRTIRWRRRELVDWIAADCPPREKWALLK